MTLEDGIHSLMLFPNKNGTPLTRKRRFYWGFATLPSLAKIGEQKLG
ncbi:hypothetical protein [Xanthomonas arboricola]|nr:hypothetical protein [Xanthomonas arboricola]